MIRELIAVGIGGAAGSAARYAISCWMLAGHTLLGFPAGRSPSMPRGRC